MALLVNLQNAAQGEKKIYKQMLQFRALIFLFASLGMISIKFFAAALR